MGKLMEYLTMLEKNSQVLLKFNFLMGLDQIRLPKLQAFRLVTSNLISKQPMVKSGSGEGTSTMVVRK